MVCVDESWVISCLCWRVERKVENWRCIDVGDVNKLANDSFNSLEARVEMVARVNVYLPTNTSGFDTRSKLPDIHRP